MYHNYLYLTWRRFCWPLFFRDSKSTVDWDFVRKLVEDQQTEGLFNGKATTCHIAIKGTIVQRTKLKGFVNNIKLNLLTVASEVPIPREILVQLRKDCCAMVIQSEDDPCVVTLHDAMFHPGPFQPLNSESINFLKQIWRSQFAPFQIPSHMWSSESD